jgi:hypothetical protein
LLLRSRGSRGNLSATYRSSQRGASGAFSKRGYTC